MDRPAYLYFRVKIPNGSAQRDALVYGRRLNADEACRLGIVDVVTEEDNMMIEAMKTLKNVGGIDRGVLSDMKANMYNKYVVNEKLSGKL